LEINLLAFELSCFKDWAEPQLDGSTHPPSHGLAKSPGGELQCGSLTLEQPRVTVRVEDPFTKKVMEHSLPCGSLWVIVEPGLQEVLYISRVARDSHEALLLG
jgi:hypothetical protein